LTRGCCIADPSTCSADNPSTNRASQIEASPPYAHLVPFPLEALLAATAPDTTPLLVEAHARLNQGLGAAELIALRQRQ
jgi:hypothetical protein